MTRIKSEHYKTPVEVLFSAMEYEELTWESVQDDTVAMVVELRDPFHEHFLCMVFADIDEVTPGLIAHECLHAARRTLEAEGMVATVDDQEPLAYLTEFYVDKVTELYEAKKGEK